MIVWLVWLCDVAGTSDQESTTSSDHSYDVASGNGHSSLMSAINGFNSSSLRQTKPAVDTADPLQNVNS